MTAPRSLPGPALPPVGTAPLPHAVPTGPTTAALDASDHETSAQSDPDTQTPHPNGRTSQVAGVGVESPAASAGDSTHKRCSRCMEEKSPTDFYSNRSRPDGLADWCRQCHSRWKTGADPVRLRLPWPDRFWSKTRITGECVVWVGSKNTYGYGAIRRGQETVPVHRLAYEYWVGPIPDGLVIDHLCRNRACITPDHLEPVTNKENILRGRSFSAVNARKTHCINGHELAPPQPGDGPRPECQPCKDMPRRRSHG